jgi:hypothetical protein
MPNCETPNISKVEPLDGTKLKIYYNGKSKVIDLSTSDLIDRFPKLKDRKYFTSVTHHSGLLEWPDDFHLDLDELVNDWPDADEGSFSTKIAGHYSNK